MSPFGFLKKSQPEAEEKEKADGGFLVFENTSEVIQAENLLKKKGWEVRVMGPPPEIRSRYEYSGGGCCGSPYESVSGVLRTPDPCNPRGGNNPTHTRSTESFCEGRTMQDIKKPRLTETVKGAG